MALSPVSRWVRSLSMIAAVLVVLSQLLRLGVGWLLGPDARMTTAYTLTYSLALLSMAAMLLALTAIYSRESASLGRLGAIGYLTAFLGTVLVAGDWWFEAFAIPVIATEAPAVLELPPAGSMLVGVVATVGLYTVGWVTLSVAALRAGAFPRSAGLLLLAGALAGPLALSTPYQIPLAVAVAWVGYTLGPGPPSRRTAANANPLGPPRPAGHP